MVSLWPCLRDSYLPRLLNAIKVANISAAVSPSVPILPLLLILTRQVEALWMTASEGVLFEPNFPPSAGRTPRWDDIPVIKFGSRGGNTISPVSIAHAIEVCQACSRR